MDYHNLAMGPASGTQYINVVIEGVFNLPKIERKRINFYPNPSETYLQFSMQSFDYRIFSISGALVEKGQTTSGLVNTERLQSGNYLIQVDSELEKTTFFFNKK